MTYERLEHMERVPLNEISNHREWNSSHHAVIHTTATDFKIQIVSDTS